MFVLNYVCIKIFNIIVLNYYYFVFLNIFNVLVLKIKFKK